MLLSMVGSAVVLFSSLLPVGLPAGLPVGPMVAADAGRGTGECSEESAGDDVRVVFSEVDGEIEVVVEDLEELEDDVRVIFYEVDGQVHVMLGQ